MTQCLNNQELTRLLNNAPGESGDEADGIAHLSECDDCSQRLEALSVSDFPQIKSTQVGGMCDSVLSESGCASGPKVTEQEMILSEIGPYKLLELAGTGAMGSVFRARDRKLNRVVAVKVLNEKLKHLDWTMIEQEAQAGARSEHPNVITVYSSESHLIPLGDNQNRLVHLLVMQFVEGKTLADHARQHSLSQKEIVTSIVQVADGVHAAHQQGVIHRDIKPANIMLDFETGQARIGDFGLAVDMDQADAANSFFGGTPGFIAPELNAGQRPGVASDLFSLGMTLKQALKSTEGEGEIPRELNSVIEKAVQPDVSKRYQSIELFRDDLQGWLQGGSVSTFAATPLARFARWMRSNQQLAMLLTGFVLLAILGGVVAWQNRQVNDLHGVQKQTRSELKSAVSNAERSRDRLISQTHLEIEKLLQEYFTNPAQPDQVNDRMAMAIAAIRKTKESRLPSLPVAEQLDWHIQQANAERVSGNELGSLSHFEQAVALAARLSSSTPLEPMVAFRFVRGCRYAAELNLKNERWNHVSECLANLEKYKHQVRPEGLLQQKRLQLNMMCARMLQLRADLQEGKIDSEVQPDLAEMNSDVISLLEIDFRPAFGNNKHQIELAWRAVLANLAANNRACAKGILGTAFRIDEEKQSRLDCNSRVREWKQATSEFVRTDRFDFAAETNDRILKILEGDEFSGDPTWQAQEIGRANKMRELLIILN